MTATQPAPPVPTGTTQLVDVGGFRLNLWRAGDVGAAPGAGGRPVVLLVHGIPTNHLLWHDVVPALAEDADVLAVDMLGFGWSDEPGDRPVDIASQAGYVLALLDVLGVERVTVVGHDLGGGVAQLLATSSGHRVNGMTVIDGVCFDGWPVPVVKALKLVWPLVRVAPSSLVAAGLERGLRLLFGQQDSAREFVPRFAAPWRDAGGPQRLTRHLRALDSVFTEAVAPFLPRLSLPVEVVWGRLDHQMKPAYGQRLADAVPGARLTWVEGASHFVPADAPETVVSVVRRLLDRVASDSGRGSVSDSGRGPGDRPAASR